jgi:hypothetical protein
VGDSTWCERRRNASANHAFAGVPPQSLDSDSSTHTLVWVLRGEQIHDAERQARLKIRKIEQAHGGRLWVSANLPHGAVFKFTVPAGDD